MNELRETTRIQHKEKKKEEKKLSSILVGWTQKCQHTYRVQARHTEEIMKRQYLKI